MMTVTGVSTASKRAKAQRATLRLYVAGVAPNSRRAEAHLEAALAELSLAPETVGLELIDVLSDARRVMADNIIVTPTLVGTTPVQRLVMIGDLSDADKLRDFLRTLFSGT